MRKLAVLCTLALGLAPLACDAKDDGGKKEADKKSAEKKGEEKGEEKKEEEKKEDGGW